MFKIPRSYYFLSKFKGFYFNSQIEDFFSLVYQTKGFSRINDISNYIHNIILFQKNYVF